MRLVHARPSLAFLLALAFAAQVSAQTPQQVAPLMEGVTAHSFGWTGNNSFSLSLANNLRDPVGNVNCLVVFLQQRRPAFSRCESERLATRRGVGRQSRAAHQHRAWCRPFASLDR